MERRKNTMSTTIRPEISTNNKYYISRERYRELVHFCRQYPEWKRAYQRLETITNPYGGAVNRIEKGYDHSDPTAKIGEQKAYYSKRMDLVRNTALTADPEIGEYIFKAVTEGRSFSYLATTLKMPCGKSMYYDRYRKFFWMLSKER
jgi:hypothetical protein